METIKYVSIDIIVSKMNHDFNYSKVYLHLRCSVLIMMYCIMYLLYIYLLSWLTYNLKLKYIYFLYTDMYHV